MKPCHTHALAVLAVAAMLSACAGRTPPPEPAPVVAPAPEEQRAKPQRPFPADTFGDLLIAEFALRRGAYELALGHYLQQAHNTRDAGVTARAARLAQFLRADRAALDAAQLWVEVDPDNLEARYTLATLLARFQRPLDALPHMIKVQEGGATANFAALAAASLEQSDSVQQQLLDALNQQLETHPDNAELLSGKALLLQTRGELDSALALVRRVLDQEPDNVHAIIIEARLLQQLERVDEAQARLRQVVDRHPDNRRLRLQYARLLTRTDIEEARRQFEVMVRQSPDDPELLLSLALLSQEVGATDAAELYFTRLLALDERSNEAHFYLGQIAESRNQINEALRHYRAITPSQEFFAGVGRSTGLLLRRDGLAVARAYLAELRGSHPEHAVRLYLFESELLLQQERLGAAHQLLTEALALYPQQPSLLYSRSLVSEQRGDIALVEQDLRAVLAQDPDNSIALNALGYTLANLTDRYEEAWQLVSKALQVSPDEPAILDSAGWVAYKRGQLDQALDYLQRAYAAFKDEEVAAHLGEVLWMLGRQEEARRIWSEALQAQPDAPTLRATVRRLTGEAP